jgi:phosphoribosylglycinamide formyltransferase 2
MVTLISQTQSEFALHVRAILGVELQHIEQLGAAASCAILAEGRGRDIRYAGVADALDGTATDLRLFGKPEIAGKRRLGVALARAADIDAARARARAVAGAITIDID